MNILLFSHTFLPKVGGRELVVHYLAKSLNDLGCVVRVVGPTGWVRNRKYKFDYAVNRYPSLAHMKYGKSRLATQIREYESYTKLLFDISKNGCDIIHAHTTYPAGYIASLVTRKRKDVRLVVTPHGVDIHTIPRLGHGMRLNPILQPRINQVLKTADCITSISAGMEKSILAAGADKDKVFRVPNGVDLERFSRAARFNIYEHYKINVNAKLIITVGNYHPRKGHEVILKSMPILLDKDPNVHLIIVGRNSDKLKHLIQEYKINENVTLTGSVPFSISDSTIISNGEFQTGHDILVALYKSSLLYISAGTEHGSEGLSLAVLEAMAAGLPIVATEISGNTDIITDGNNGFLVEPSNHVQLAEKILYLLEHENIRKSLSRNAHETANKNDWIEIAKKYIEIYKRLLNTKDIK